LSDFSRDALALADAGAWRDAVDTDAKTTYGSNVNGEFWRWENGLQICRHSLSQQTTLTTTNDFGTTAGTMRYNDTTWTFPAAFLVAPSCFNLGGLASTTGTPSTVSVLSRVLHSSNLTFTVSIFAIGSWS